MTAGNIVLVLLPQICCASIAVTLKFVRYDHVGEGRMANGRCCTTFFSKCIVPCDPSIRVCVSSQTIPGMCNIYNGETKQFGRMKTITFDNNMGAVPNPLVLPVGQWEQGLYFIFTVNNGGEGKKPSLMERLNWHLNKTQIVYQGIGKISPHKISGKDVALTLHIGIDCSKDFYGKQCKVYCKDSDDQTGHYNCEDDGHKLCMKGWKGSNCTEPENACDRNSCQNNATCYITKGPIATYRCECTSAYTGTHCTESWNILRNATIAQETSTLAPTTRVQPKPTPAYTPSTRPPPYSMTCTPSQALQFGIDGQTSSPDVVRNVIKRFLSERGVSDIYNVDIIEKDISGYRHPHVVITPLRQPNITENIELLIIEHVKHLTGHHAEEPHCVDMKQGTKGHVQARFDSSEPRISSAAVAGVSVGILLLICIIVGTIILQRRCWGYKIWPSSQRSTETGAVSHGKECQTQYNVDVFVPGSNGECAVISLPPRACSLGRIVEGKHGL